MMVDLTDRQRRVLASLDFPLPCTVSFEGKDPAPCEQTASWQMGCKGCGKRSLLCEEHHAMLLASATSTNWQCPRCDLVGPLADVFRFELIREKQS